jgi:hypothetical protein
MKAIFLWAGAIAAAASLSGCSTFQGSRAETQTGTQIYRSHLGQPIARSQIAVEAFQPADANSPEFRIYSTAVAQELRRLGWTVVNTGTQSEQVALVDVSQGSASRMGIGAGAPAVPATAGTSASTGVATSLGVRIKRRSDGTVFWEGQSVDEGRGSGSAGERTAAVQRLAAALFRDFPGESGRTIRAR